MPVSPTEVRAARLVSRVFSLAPFADAAFLESYARKPFVSSVSRQLTEGVLCLIETDLSAIRPTALDRVIPHGRRDTRRRIPKEARYNNALALSKSLTRSLVLYDVHMRSTVCGHIARYFHKHLVYPVHINLYATPRGAQTFPAHVDGHDVWIFHLRGVKTWSIWNRVKPLDHNATKIVKPLPPRTTVQMTPGTLLYLPKWTPHRARARTASLHLTIGIRTLNIAQAIERLVRCAGRPFDATGYFGETEFPLHRALTRAEALCATSQLQYMCEFLSRLRPKDIRKQLLDEQSRAVGSALRVNA